jgi:hypothetical protein
MNFNNMKYLNKLSVFIFSLLSICVISCKEEERKPKKTAVFELRQLIQETESYSSKTGVFFMFGGYYNEKEEKETTVKVFAKVEGRYRLIEMPIQDVRIVIDDMLFKPHVQIEYYSMSDFSDEEIVSNNDLSSKVFVITCPERYIPEKLLPIDLHKKTNNF